MKKIILTIAFFALALSSFAQEVKLPETKDMKDDRITALAGFGLVYLGGVIYATNGPSNSGEQMSRNLYQYGGAAIAIFGGVVMVNNLISYRVRKNLQVKQQGAGVGLSLKF